MRTIRTDKKRSDFLAGLAGGLSVTGAAKLVGMGRSAAYKWRADDEAFAADWEDAIEEGTDDLEDRAMERAKSGQSDTMMIFMLKARRPEKYKERSHVENVNSGGVTYNVVTGIEAAPNSKKDEDK